MTGSQAASLPVRVLFVCMGNICRSPLAEGTFRQLVDSRGLSDVIDIDSAGTHFYHIGELPDPRSIEIARENGLDITDQRGRQIDTEDYHTFHYILAMDKRNLRNIESLAPQSHQAEIHLYLQSFAPHLLDVEVPDPYHGGEDGFQEVFTMVETAAKGLLDAIEAKHLSNAV